MRELLQRLKEAVPNLSPGYLADMAWAVDERASDLAEYGDPRDYDKLDGKDRHVQALVDAAKVLEVLAEIAAEVEGRNEP